tara:strand:- start:45 stop:986 length:942 start_codon:yes stop_codon:yes gene_type:complete
MKTKSLTFKECRDLTLKTHQPWKDGGGRKSAISYSDTFLKYTHMSIPIERITRRLLIEIACELQDTKGWTYAACNRLNSAVSMPLKHCQNDLAVISQDWQIPSFKTWDERKQKKSYEAYTKDEVAEMCDFATHGLLLPELADIIWFAALTGIRAERVMQLTVSRVFIDDDNPDNTFIRVTKAKGMKDRTVPINDALMPIIKARIAGQNPRKRLFGDDWLNYDSMYRQFKKCVHTHLGKPKDGHWTFHSLRHSFGTWHIQDGTNIRDLADFMGHSSTKVTEMYLHATVKGRNKIMNNVKVNMNHSTRSSWRAAS